MPDRKYLSKWFEEIMTTTDFADVLEIDTSKEIRKKKVLLVITGDEPDAKSIKYALNVCKRVNAGLDILCITSDAKYAAQMEEHLRRLIQNGTQYHIAKKTKSVQDMVVHYIEQSASVEFVVIDSRDIEGSTSSEDRRAIEEWKGLKCPLVLVS